MVQYTLMMKRTYGQIWGWMIDFAVNYFKCLLSPDLAYSIENPDLLGESIL
jgi:hypothetical protein